MGAARPCAAFRGADSHQLSREAGPHCTWACAVGEAGTHRCAGPGRGGQPRRTGAEAAVVTAHDFAAVTAALRVSVSSPVRWG